ADRRRLLDDHEADPGMRRRVPAAAYGSPDLASHGSDFGHLHRVAVPDGVWRACRRSAVDRSSLAGHVGHCGTARADAGMKNRLKVLRAERDWSQQDLARHLGVSRQSVNAIETGKFDPSLPLAFRIADLFGLAIEEIFLRD